ncbi:solute carrier family 7 member 14-like [Apostichopus japonicus]|uniref:solute carrier family 7 member 14-like n=1 Tax=Stichopus japonicus TaxID=307972 RepID=UPI003AB90A1E
MGVIRDIAARLVRVREIEADTGSDFAEGGIPGRLPKCLTTLDLISLGVGSCMGTGMYVVSGMVAREMAGPGVILSFLIAAAASLLSGVCYAEFGVRVPKTTGSAYMYSYVTVGEFAAFVIGWNLILEYLIGTAAGASALSSCLDALVRNKISTFMMDNVGGFGIHTKTYPDLVALVIAVALTLIVAAGVKKSVTFNNILNSINLAVWVFMVAGGLFFFNINNWTETGFLPFGISGVMTGAATCFYAFIGFDIIATTGEEAKDPSRSIPIAIMASLVVCLIGYVSISFVLTLAVPFYHISTESPLMDMFVQNNAEVGKYVVFVGSLAGLTVSLLGSIFPMPRVIYAMAVDGLLFRSLSKINHVTHTPAIATIISGFLAAILALMVSLKDLIEMMSIGTLLAYTIVSMCVLILRYQPHVDVVSALESNLAYGRLAEDGDGTAPPSSEAAATLEEAGVDKLLPKLQGEDGFHSPKPFYGAVDEEPSNGFRNYSQSQFIRSRVREWTFANMERLRVRLQLPVASELPTPDTGRSITLTTLLLFVLLFITCALFVFGGGAAGRWWGVILVIVLILCMLLCLWNIMRLPQNPDRLKFMAPGLPFLPIVAMFINIFLMLKLSYLTWVRFVIWMFIGLLIYFGYGIWHSSIEGRNSEILRQRVKNKQVVLMESTGVPVTTEQNIITAHTRKTDKAPEDTKPLAEDFQPE